MNQAEKPGFYRWRPAACLRVSGEDALTFLQGQFTNDLQQRETDGATYGLWLNQKGKVLADSFVRKSAANEAWIVSYFSPAAVIRERLEAYIIADDVMIEDVTESMRGLTVFGAATAADLGLGAPAWSFRGRRARRGAHGNYFSHGNGSSDERQAGRQDRAGRRTNGAEANRRRHSRGAGGHRAYGPAERRRAGDGGDLVYEGLLSRAGSDGAAEEPGPGPPPATACVRHR